MDKELEGTSLCNIKKVGVCIYFKLTVHLHSSKFIGDGHNYTRTKKRYYLATLLGLRRSVTAWLSESARLPSAPFFVLQLGDLVDGHATTTKLGSEASLARVLEEFKPLAHCSVHHCLGNHEFYNFPSRAFWANRLACFRDRRPPAFPNAPTPPRDSCYYAFLPHPKFCFVNLDTYDISVLGSAPDSPEGTEAERYLRRNPNEDRNSPLGLEGLEKRFVRFGGGVGARQLAWLRATLLAAQGAGCKHVVMFSHIPLHPDVCKPDCLLWNFQEILDALEEHPALVKLCLAGHSHEARVVHDEGSGIVYYTLDAPLEQMPNEDAFSTARVYADRIEIDGEGANISVQFRIRESAGRR